MPRRRVLLVHEMRDLPISLRWAALAILSLTLYALFQFIHLPAAALLGAMAAGIVIASNDGRLTLPRWYLLTSQTAIGCLMAQSITPAILKTMVAQWPLFLGVTLGVIGACTVLGVILSRLRIMPGTTAVWGLAPGASTVMVLMSEAFGTDFRLVAFMQYMRLVVVGAAASLVARIFVGGTQDAPPPDWFGAVAPMPFAATLAVVILAAVVSTWRSFPGGAFLIAFIAATLLSVTGAMTITLPPLFLLASFIGVGWFIGLRFTAEIVRYAARMFPRVLVAVVALVILCGGLAYVLHLMTGVDMLTAYFATSPGGADAVAIIASSSQVDQPFVMAMQMARLLFLIVAGPVVARFGARWAESDPG